MYTKLEDSCVHCLMVGTSRENQSWDLGFHGKFITNASPVPLSHWLPNSNALCCRGCPIYWKTHQLLLGLKPSDSHGAIAAKDIILDGLKPFGIEASDIFLTMSDTASTALKTGREILEAGCDEIGATASNRSDPGECGMHVLNLIVDHASGKKIRTKKKVIVDEFVAGATLREAQIKILSHINSKRQKVACHLYRSIAYPYLHILTDTTMIGKSRAARGVFC